MFSLKKTKIFLISTGLGRINRGFESYIYDLGRLLHNNNFSVELFGGAPFLMPMVYTNLLSISRTNPICTLFKVSDNNRFQLEQLTFFFSLIPYILFKGPKVIYLGEYFLYCLIFKFRKLTNGKYSLVLYTGGQAVPGLFDQSRDFIHHVTDVYYKSLLDQGISPKRQFVIPHFLDFPFEYNDTLYSRIMKMANGKKVVLSVGLIDKNIKQMHLIPELLSNCSNLFFPVIIGDQSSSSDEVKKIFINHFGENGFWMGKVERSELGAFYKAASLFLLCSKRESFGLVYLEALSHGIPVITNDFYEARYVCKSFAYYLNLKNISKAKIDFNDFILQLNKSADLSYKRVDYVNKEFSIDALGKKYLNMFEIFCRNN